MDQEPVLTFDRESHTYRLRGQPVPGVTSLLDDTIVDLSRIPRDVLERARARGTAVHVACELYDRGDLDFATMDQSLWPYLQAWDRFKTETKFEIELIEKPVYSERYRYAGTLDRYGHGRFRSKSKLSTALIDIKSGEVQTATGVQLAAYHGAGVEMGAVDKSAIRIGVHLQDTGKYKLEVYDSPQDWPVFLACLQIHHYKRRAA